MRSKGDDGFGEDNGEGFFGSTEDWGAAGGGSGSTEDS